MTEDLARLIEAQQRTTAAISAGLTQVAGAIKALVDSLSAGALLDEGSFAGTLTGMTAGTTGTVNFRVFTNAAGTGKFCTLWIDSGITGTSNTTALTMTGLDAAVQPAATRVVTMANISDDVNTNLLGQASITAGTITFAIAVDDAGTAANKIQMSTTGFTAANTKGLQAGWSITYPL